MLQAVLLGLGLAVPHLPAARRVEPTMAPHMPAVRRLEPTVVARRLPPPTMMAEREPFDMKFELPKLGKVRLRFKPLFAQSEAVVVTYQLPFELGVENKGGSAVCTKAGPGGEAVGDVLRYSTQWKLDTPNEGSVLGSAASISGNLSWQIGLFDVARATTWQEVVDVLTSNVKERVRRAPQGRLPPPPPLPFTRAPSSYSLAG